MLGRYENILVPEVNNGQLVRLLRDKYLAPAIPYNKIKGQPFAVAEIKNKVWEILNGADNRASGLY